ncbi:MAG: hypothetical protein AW07_04021 [Candidatus Accumulibacter sp. SK-11]|nr:MAG: hypothetical protein AW07_04021 [Candidatus Accumulibacter sp. SK-11]
MPRADATAVEQLTDATHGEIAAAAALRYAVEDLPLAAVEGERQQGGAVLLAEMGLQQSRCTRQEVVHGSLWLVGVGAVTQTLRRC